MNTKMYYQVVTVVFSFIALFHAARVVYGWEAIIGGAVIPVWMSAVGAAIAGYLAVRGWQFSRK